MKKFIVLNAILVIVLLSIKFSSEDLNRSRYALTRKTTFSRLRSVASSEVVSEEKASPEMRKDDVIARKTTEEPAPELVHATVPETNAQSEPPAISPPNSPVATPVAVDTPAVSPVAAPVAVDTPAVSPITAPVAVDTPPNSPVATPVAVDTSPLADEKVVLELLHKKLQEFKLQSETPILASSMKNGKEAPTEPTYPYQPYLLPKRLALSHNQGTPVSYKHFGASYSLIELLMATDYKLDSFLPMLDLRGIRFDNTSYAASGGVIVRYIPSAFCNLLGANLYYDYRQGIKGKQNQISVGLEILSRRWDLRANMYFPFGKSHHSAQCNPGWFAFSFNGEFGYLLVNSSSFLLYSAIGPYYIAGQHCSSRKMGGLFRLVPQYKDYFALDLKLSYDSLYHTVFQGEVIFSLPLYQIYIGEKGPCGITNRQIYQRVERMF